MDLGSYGIAIAFAFGGGLVAGLVQWRLPARRYGSILAGVSFCSALVLAYWLVKAHLPPLPSWASGTPGRLDEPWETIFVPMIGVTLFWLCVPKASTFPPTLRLLIGMSLACWPMVTCLPAGESYADVLPGNAPWSIAGLIAVGFNQLAVERLDGTATERWSAWVLVAQLLTVTALYLSCFASLGEVCLLSAMTLIVLATIRLTLGSGQWSTDLALPATVWACVLLTHVRVYSGLALPVWLAPIAFFSPAIVCAVDHFFGSKRTGLVRAAIAACAAALMAAAVIARLVLPLLLSSESAY